MTHNSTNLVSRFAVAPVLACSWAKKVSSIVLSALLLITMFPAIAAAQEVEDIAQNSSVSIPLEPNGDGWPDGVSAELVASADLDQIVVDVYLDDVLVSSETNPTSLDIAFEPSLDDRVLRVEVREFGETATCEVDSGTLQLQNLEISRIRTEAEVSLLNEETWSISADDNATVANVAAIGTFGSLVDDFLIVEDSSAVVEVGVGAAFESPEDLWEELSGQARSLPADGERLVVQKTSELSLGGGSVFISESEFGGRVGSVRLEVDALMTPQASQESGFALRLNGQIIESGSIDADGQATFDVTIDEQDWPRDATVSLDLSLVETESPCNDTRPFSGQVEIAAVPIGLPDPELSISDFPAVLLESDPAIYVSESSDHDVAVVSAALQAVSSKRLVFEEATSRSEATVVIERAEVGEVFVDAGQLVFHLDDDLVETLQQERFWIYTDETVGVELDTVEVTPEALAFVELDDGEIAIGSQRISLFQLVPFALLVIVVLAVLRLLWKNSKTTAKS